MGITLSDLNKLAETGNKDSILHPGFNIMTSSLGAPEQGFGGYLDPYNVSNLTQVASMPADDLESGGTAFFSTYFSIPRFSAETLLASLATLANAVTLLAVVCSRCQRARSVYNRLFINLAVANMMSCTLSWLCNNLLFLFNKEIVHLIVTSFNMCRLFVYLTAAVFVSSAFGIVSTVTMLGFTSVQYFAICRPLHHQAIFRTTRTRLFLAAAWGLSLLCSFLPFLALVIIAQQRDCSADLLTLISNFVVYGVNCCVGIVGAIYAIIIVLCVRIFYEIKVIGMRISRHRNERQDVKAERRAFVTIVILLCTLTVFFTPYSVIYVVSLNSKNPGFGFKDEGIIYYMTILPYFKFLSDPLIYGLRMREVKDGCLRMLAKCGLGNCPCLKSQMNKIFQPVHVRTNSLYLHRLSSRSTSVS